MTERLNPEADFSDFARATVDIAGELYGNGGRVQRVLAEAWTAVGLTASVVECTNAHLPIHGRRQRAVAVERTPKWRRRPMR